MHPPTPYPAFARSKSKFQNDPCDKALREITSRANATSKSEQDFSSVLMKADDEVSGKHSKKTPRRYSVASKFGGTKAVSADVSSSTTALEGKPKVNKQASLQDTVHGPQFVMTQTSMVSRRSAEVICSKNKSTIPIKGPATRTLNTIVPTKKQPLVSKQESSLHKPISVLHQRSVSGNEKAPVIHTAQSNKARATMLKSACYWLEQIKLTEVIEKHGVSIGFFRLAVECEAEPVELLREELVAYIKRYSIWSDTIKQVLLCYGVTEHAQDIMFSKISDTGISESSSPCTPTRSNDKDSASQALKNHLQHSDEVSCTVFSEGTVDTSSVNEEVLNFPKLLMLDNTGHIKSMDADSITREVVSCLLSSMGASDGSQNLKNAEFSRPEDYMRLLCSERNDHVHDPVMSLQESISIQSSAGLDEATSTGSMPSLNVWNTVFKEADTGISDAVQEVNNVSDSAILPIVVGEAMCVSMELDDSIDDNLSELQSKSPAGGVFLDETDGNQKICETVKNSDHIKDSNEIIISSENHETFRSSFYGGSHNEASEIVQAIERGESGSRKNGKPKSVSIKSQTVKSTARSESQSNGSLGAKYRNGKEKDGTVSEEKNVETLASKTEVTPAASKSRCLSTSTPKSSSMAHMSNIEAGSRTCRKCRAPQPTVLDSGSIDSAKITNGAMEGILVTPTQSNADGFKQVSLEHYASMDIQNADAMVTPGSTGVRRSARLRPAGGSTVPTPTTSTRIKRQLGTPKKAEK